MEEFKKIGNFNKLLLGSIKMVKEKLKLDIDNDLIKEIIAIKYNNIILSYTSKEYDIKKLNNFCLTSIKNYFEENKDNNKKCQNDIINTDSSNTVNNNYDKKIDTDLLELKVKELEIKRNYIPDYEKTLPSSSNTQEHLLNSSSNIKDTITTINYNNNNNNNIIYKSFIINSTNLNISNILKINYKDYKFIPDSLFLPIFVNELTPYIKLKIYDDINEVIYIFSPIIKNKKWDIWKTIDNYNININLNNSKIELFDYHNNLLDFGYNFIKIEKFLEITKKNYKLYKLWCEKDDIYNFNNNYEINDNIIIKNNYNSYYTKKIIDLSDNNSFIIYDNNNELNTEYFKDSSIILEKNQCSLLIKYYIK